MNDRGDLGSADPICTSVSDIGELWTFCYADIAPSTQQHLFKDTWIAQVCRQNLEEVSLAAYSLGDTERKCRIGMSLLRPPTEGVVRTLSNSQRSKHPSAERYYQQSLISTVLGANRL